MKTMPDRTTNGPEVDAVNRKKILLINDLDLFLELKRTFLHREDLDMLSTGSGADAYAMAQHYRPDLVFLDLRMKEMDGDECCRQIKNNPELCSIPVTMLVDDQEEGSLERCREAGCDHVLSKPLDPDQLIAIVRQYQLVVERTAPRIDARLRVRLAQDQSLLTTYSVNLSTGGLFLEMADPLPAETLLNLEFDLPNSSGIIRCKGRVAWVNALDHRKKEQLPPGIGIQFMSLTMEDMDKIREFVKRQCISPAW